jgi:hypothetical protein
VQVLTALHKAEALVGFEHGDLRIRWVSGPLVLLLQAIQQQQQQQHGM